MRTMKLGNSTLKVPVVAVSCMRINSLNKTEAEHFIRTALQEGANFFDHADIYGGGTCEEIFSEAVHMNDDIREKVILQSKCGIGKGMSVFSKEHILQSVDGILNRLKTDYLDILLLHRPDALVNGMNVNMENDAAVNRDGSVLDYCRLNDITIQPWSPFQYGFFEGVFLGNDKFPELNLKIDENAEKYEVSNTTIAIAWLLHHPAHMQPVIGTMNIDRLKDCCKASDIHMTRAEWYDIYRAAGNVLP